MKRMLLVIGILSLSASWAIGEEGDRLIIQSAIPDIIQQPQHILTFRADGQILIDDKPIEKMSDPEIKTAIKEIAAAMRKQSENDALVNYYDRQTGYLLEELEKCHQKCQ